MTGASHSQIAFSRNVGWITADEAKSLRGKCVAIGGLGGVGGAHLLTLTRLGISKFHITDFDRFELINFNRQTGASISNLHRAKVDALTEMALDINPHLEIKAFPQGINAGNVHEFLKGADLYLDGLDFFAIEPRRVVFKACEELRIPAVTVAPLGMGAALLSFLPGHMTFEEYFQLEGHPYQEQLARFLLGVSPALLQASYLADPTALDMIHGKAPSTPMGCSLATGIAGVEVLKILLNRGRIIAAPRGLHFDAYRQKLSHTWRPWGNRNPIQRLALMIARKRLAKNLPTQQPAAV